jgi:hypothetical protein
LKHIDWLMWHEVNLERERERRERERERCHCNFEVTTKLAIEMSVVLVATVNNTQQIPLTKQNHVHIGLQPASLSICVVQTHIYRAIAIYAAYDKINLFKFQYYINHYTATIFTFN